MEKIQRFNLIRRIGQGGMAEVFLAEADYNGIKKTVALKKILQPLSKNSHFKETFHEEARLSIELNHPNAVQVFEYGQTSDSNHLFMIMEFVDGVDLMKLIRQAESVGKKLPQGIGAYIVSEVLKGLDYAHRLKGSDGTAFNLVHRDMSPQNILLSYEGAIKVTDFGIAKALDKEEEKGVLRGKFHYMSPEQARTEDVDSRSDIFAVGLILYQLVTGENPYGKLKGIKALEAAKTADIPPPSLKTSISVELEKIISKALAPNREKRYQRAKDMHVDLSRYLHNISIIYDSTSLIELMDELFPEKNRLPLRNSVDSNTFNQDKTGTKSGKSLSDSLGYTMETFSGKSSFKESKNLVSMVVYIGGIKEAETRYAKGRVSGEVDNFFDMVQNILNKDKQNRYRYRKVSENTLLVVRGIPYVGEYDETELLKDAFKIKRDFFTYKEEIRELDVGIGVFRANVDLEYGKDTIKWFVSSHDLQDATWLAHDLKNEIVVSPQVYAAAKYNWEMEEFGDDLTMKKYRLLRLKNKSERINSRRAEELVGVSFEKDRLRRCFFRVLEKTKMEYIVILGDMGVGKTSLIQSFLEEIKKDAQEIRVEARPYHNTIPFSIAINFVKDIVRREYGEAETNFTKKLKEYLTGIILDEEALNKTIDAFESIMDSTDESIAGANTPVLVARAMEITLKSLSFQKPVVAVFEDLQWSDEQSKTIFKYLMEKEHFSGRVMFIFSAREEDNLSGSFKIESPLIIQNMDESTALKYVSSHFLNPENAEPVINEIVKRGEGNPFFLKELIISTIDMELCIPQNKFGGKLILSNTLPENFDLGMSSPTLEGIISSRLDSLDPGLRRVLRLAAVFGRSFKKDALDSIIDEDSDPYLQHFVKRKVLRRHGKSNKYSFVQQIVRDFAYKGIPEDEKRLAHLEIAQLKINNQTEKGAHNYPVIAAHFEQGGDRRNAADYYLKAAHHARRLSSNEEAKKHYLKVLDLVPEDKKLEYHAHKDLEMIFNNLGLRDGQMKQISQMLTLADEEENLNWKSEAMCRRMAYFQGISELNKTVDLFKVTFKTAVKAENYYCQADAYRILARAKVEMGEIEEALEIVDNAINLVKEHPEISGIMSDLLHIKGNALYYRGKMDEAIETYKMALEKFRKEHKRTQEATILMNLGFLSSIMGAYETAINYYKRAYDIDIEKGDRLNTGIKLSNLAQTHIELGNYAQAKKLLKQARKLCELTRDTGALSDTTLTIAQLKIRSGKFSEAMRHINNGIEYALSSASKIDEIRGWLLWSECQLDDPNGNYRIALEKADKAIEISEKSKITGVLIYGLSLKARSLYLLKRYEQALNFSSRAVSLTIVSKIHGVDSIYHVHGKIMKALGEDYWAELFLRKAMDEVMRKASLLSQEQAVTRFLSVQPSVNILHDYRKINEKQ